MQLSAGDKLGPYEILSLMGKGGMGEVYRAHDSRLHRDVAIKVVQNEMADRAALGRFQREARAASALTHPNICTVFDTGETDGQPYLVMELLNGQTLTERIGARPVGCSEAVAIAMQIADALEAAHSKGILHRDVKPGNVMIVGRGQVKVLDFGLAKQIAVDESEDTLTLQTETRAGTVMGTPAYLSPEVLQGANSDARSDLWALGVVLYQMLSGHLPFRGSTSPEISSGILKEAPPPLPSTVPRELRMVTGRCLEKNPQLRYQTATEVRKCLEAVFTSISRPAAPKAVSRIWVLGLTISIAAAAGLFWWQQRMADQGPTKVLGSYQSQVQEANELFELAENQMIVQNDISKALGTLERSLALDPKFAKARLFHATNTVVYLFNGYSNDAKLLYRAEEELRQVIRETPDLPRLPGGKAAVYLALGRKDLIPLDQLGRDHTSNVWLMIIHLMSEENLKARQHAENILRLQPLVGAIRMFYGELLRSQGDTKGAIRELLKVVDQAPTNVAALHFLVHAYVDQHELEKARSHLERTRAQFASNYLWRQTNALALAAEGKGREAMEAMDEETQKFASTVLMVTSVNADFYGILGNKDKALEWIAKAVRNGDERVGYFQRNPSLAIIQKEPGFRRIVESIESRRVKK